MYGISTYIYHTNQPCLQIYHTWMVWGIEKNSDDDFPTIDQGSGNGLCVLACDGFVQQKVAILCDLFGMVKRPFKWLLVTSK